MKKQTLPRVPGAGLKTEVFSQETILNLVEKTLLQRRNYARVAASSMIQRKAPSIFHEQSSAHMQVVSERVIQREVMAMLTPPTPPPHPPPTPHQPPPRRESKCFLTRIAHVLKAVSTSHSGFNINLLRRGMTEVRLLRICFAYCWFFFFFFLNLFWLQHVSGLMHF